MAMERISRTRVRGTGTAPSPIQFVQGDATRPVGPGTKILVNLGLDTGLCEGRGFASSLARRWPDVTRQYENWARGLLSGAPPFRPGEVLLVRVDPQVWVAKIVAKAVHSTGGRGRVRVDYGALERGLETLATEALRIGASVHLPRLGCDAAGARWDRIEAMIQRHLASAGIPVVVYDFAAVAAQGVSAQPELF
jgi:hypothetical protein